MSDAWQHGSVASDVPCCVGQRLACSICGTAVVVLSVRHDGVRLDCCGRSIALAAPVGCGSPLGSPRPSASTGLRAGIVYGDADSGLVARCIRAGTGVVTVSGRALIPRLRLQTACPNVPAPESR